MEGCASGARKARVKSRAVPTRKCARQWYPPPPIPLHQPSVWPISLQRSSTASLRHHILTQPDAPRPHTTTSLPKPAPTPKCTAKRAQTSAPPGCSNVCWTRSSRGRVPELRTRTSLCPQDAHDPLMSCDPLTARHRGYCRALHPFISTVCSAVHVPNTHTRIVPSRDELKSRSLCTARP